MNYEGNIENIINLLASAAGYNKIINWKNVYIYILKKQYI